MWCKLFVLNFILAVYCSINHVMLLFAAGQGGVLRGELDILGNELRRVGASLCGSIEHLVNHCTHTFSTSGLAAAAAACKPLQIGRHRIKVTISL